MKQLQNNFTTPEQSKHLLLLGVPSNSADCFLIRNKFVEKEFYIKVLRVSDNLTYDEMYKDTFLFEYLPCWSIGRLKEICKICLPKEDYEIATDECKYCKDFTKAYISAIEYNMPVIDFSKLED